MYDCYEKIKPILPLSSMIYQKTYGVCFHLGVWNYQRARMYHELRQDPSRSWRGTSQWRWIAVNQTPVVQTVGLVQKSQMMWREVLGKTKSSGVGSICVYHMCPSICCCCSKEGLYIRDFYSHCVCQLPYVYHMLGASMGWLSVPGDFPRCLDCHCGMRDHTEKKKICWPLHIWIVEWWLNQQQ